ncbi:MAG: acetyl-CoA C-acyltransferase [Ignavibacteriales bacterium CG07_land_8_20_14_0_80_59_12]|nr:MAG: acetyl-CoA C-acyltransferase [Ignavibacteriales bacterium CG07_land_8_20_14_0_80_59_12]
MDQAVIASACRTPVGSLSGSLSGLTAPQLGAVVIREAVKRAGLKPEDVNEVIFGNVLSAGLGQAPARQAAIFAGLPVSVECLTINKMCGSGLKSVGLAAQAVALGDADVVVAGGMESMSNAPYLLDGARRGYRMGHAQVIDSMIKDGLWDVYNNFHMGSAAELCARECAIPREAQDTFAVESYRRALEAQKSGAFTDEIVPVATPQRKGEPVMISADEEPGKVDLSRVSSLKTAFEKDGTVTAANASKISDGAAAVVVMAAERAAARGVRPLARIVAQASAAKRPEYFTTAPVDAVEKVLRKANLTIADIDLFEINEAFAVVALVALNQLGIDPAKLNVHGGAVALGHPIGASGARILTTLLYAMKQRNARLGLAALCIGGGEATAMIVERV